MAATCAELGDSQEKPSYESRLVAASAGPGAHWGWLLLVWEDLGSCEAWAKTSHSYGKVTIITLGGSVIWVGQSIRGSPGRGKQCYPGSWSLRYGTCLPALWLYWFRNGQWPLSNFLSGRKLFPSFHLDGRHFSFSLYATGDFQAATLVLELIRTESIGEFFKVHCLRS